MTTAIAVLGEGAAACAVAADLALGGHAVRLWSPAAAELAALRDAGALTIAGERRERKATLAAITADLGEAVAGTEIVVGAVPAASQEDLGKRLAPHLTERQIVLLTTGLFGAWVVAREVTRAGGTLPLAIAEAAMPPHLARMRGPAEVAIAVRAAHLPVGVLPAARSDAALAEIARCLPATTPCSDALDVALANPWVAIRPASFLLTAGASERERSEVPLVSRRPLLRRLVDAVDGERVDARRGLGYPAPHWELPQGVEVGPNPALYGADAVARLAKGGLEAEAVDLDHAWVREEAVLGLSLLESAARTAGVTSPTVSGLLLVFGALQGRRLSGAGRALEALGLGDLLWREIRGLLREGWTSRAWERVTA